MRSWCLASWILLLLVVALTAGLAVAQSDQGSIAGTILDSSGAVVGGAEIVATGAQTGTVYKTTSSSDGSYRLPYVRIGVYDLRISGTGFKTAERTGVVVQVNTVSALDVTLQAGDVKETITVVADAPTLQTESSDIGTVVSTRQIKDLPLALTASGQSFLRSAESFVFLTPGTTGPGTNSDSPAGGIFESKLSGGQNFATEVILDGISTQRSDSGSAYDQTAPSVEALNEFKVLTSTIPAEFGRTTGGVESFATKSGTNRFHGTAFNFFRNDKLDANSWNRNFNGNPKPRDHQNDFGGSLGGPIWIPKIYNGHDKAFFFFSWEQYRNNQGTGHVTTVPTDAQRSGDFSALLGAPTGAINPCDGSPVLRGQIFDPATTQVVGGQPCRTAFPGNIIPSNRISTVAQNVLQFLPAPTGGNGAGCAGIPVCNNFAFNSAKTIRDTTMTFKIDYNVSQKGKAFFSYSSRDQEVLNGEPVLPPPLDPNFFNSNFTHYLRGGYDYTFSPTLLNHFVIGLNRLANASIGESVNGTDWPQALGIGNAHGKVFPQFSFEGSPVNVNYQGLSTGNSDRNVPNSLVVSDSVSWVKGRHSFRFGFEWRAFQFSRLNQENTSPSYTLSNFQTAFTANDTTTGDPFASFLLGQLNSESLTVSSIQPRWISNYYAGYIQDDIKLRPNLVVNVGLRYSVDTPRHEAHNANSTLDLTADNPGTPGTPGALIFGRNATGAKTYYKNFGPRLGFSYSPGWRKNLVFRGGYAIYYAPLQYSDFGTAFMSGTTSSPSFSTPDNFRSAQDPGTGTDATLDSGFPNFTPPSNNHDPTLANGQGTSLAEPEFGKPGMIQNWSFEIQQELAKDLIFSMGYVGMHSTRLRSWLVQRNSVNPKFYALGNDLTLPVSDPQAQADIANLGLTVPSWFVPLWGGNATLGRLLRPFPQFDALDTQPLENAGQSTYHALQTKVERRFRDGLNLLASYTFSKTLTNADSSFPVFSGFQSGVFGAQNAFNLKAEKAVSFQDVPHTFVVSYLYELPAGPGKRFFNHGVASKVLGGWQVGGVHRYQTGSPLRISAGATSPPGYVANGNFRYSLLPGVPLISPNASSFNPFDPNGTGCQRDPANPNAGTFVPLNPSNNFFNCAAFLDPNAADLVAQRGFGFGNLPPFLGGIRSPSYLNEDFSIIKRTAITEGQFLTFKVDLPNAFNRHTFGPIDGDPTSSSFGVPGGSNHNVLNGARQIQITLRYEF
jgi:hypothetical protein